jgi:glycosyltransferase involved in cell wall biosynthesis
MKICFVVHRYAPYPGGSEYNVQRMAEECKRRGNEVVVFTGEHQGDFNNIRVTSDPQQSLNADVIVIHGGDVGIQNFVLQNIKNLPGKVLYLLIKPSESLVCLQGLKDAQYIGCTTPEDWDHVKKFNVEYKSHRVNYGLELEKFIGVKGKFKDKYNIPKNKRMFLSCGGYWPNKKMIELVEAFKTANLDDAILVTTGYDNRHNLMPEFSDNVIPLMVEDIKDIPNAMADADCYIMNSSEEGFGLVLIEAMINKTPWISRNIAGARLMSDYGITYDTEFDLVEILRKWRNRDVTAGYEYVVNNHHIKTTVDDIEKLLKTE